MCRLWSGRLQNMAFLDHDDFYMRLDDDSFFTADLKKDPFVQARDEQLDYMFVRRQDDPHGHSALQTIASKHGNWSGSTNSPYTNFHLARVSLFRTSHFLKFWGNLDQERLFMKHRVGDALLHSALLELFIPSLRIKKVPNLPYAHNSNDFSGYPPKNWHSECPTLVARSSVEELVDV